MCAHIKYELVCVWHKKEMEFFDQFLDTAAEQITKWFEQPSQLGSFTISCNVESDNWRRFRFRLSSAMAMLMHSSGSVTMYLLCIVIFNNDINSLIERSALPMACSFPNIRINLIRESTVKVAVSWNKQVLHFCMPGSYLLTNLLYACWRSIPKSIPIGLVYNILFCHLTWRRL